MDSEIKDVLIEDELGDGLARRRFLKSAAIAGIAAAWSAPIVQTIAPEIALAQDGLHPRPGTPRPGDTTTTTGDTPVEKDCDSDSDDSDDTSNDPNGNNSNDDSDDSDCDGDTDDNKSDSRSED